MGTQQISIAKDPESRKKFLGHLLDDVETLDEMLTMGLFESGVRRVGAEQEFCIVDKYFKPSRNGPDILSRIDDPHFTTELARYNLEINLDPLRLSGDCFTVMEQRLRHFLDVAGRAAAGYNDRIILTGILPSVDFRAVQTDFMTPKPRYEALSEIMAELRGEDFELNITAVDELILRHTNILFEACNTSFQCHYQADPGDFADLYNWSQMISGPVLAVCTNSPLLFGKQLWAETRIPLFQQSVDTRGKGYHLREREQRVTFGDRWVKSVTDVYKNDIARHTVLFMTEIGESSAGQLRRGEVPTLEALCLHNGTIYKWNRPCYGVTDGVPHLRIENRYIPSGPTARDEIANLAFWCGLMSGMPSRFRNIGATVSFEEAKENFYKAAMWGIQGGMVWEGELMSARSLILEILIPAAKKGLEKLEIDEEDIDRNLDIIKKRAAGYHTGSRWIVRSFRELRRHFDRDEASVALTAILHNRRMSEKPVHEWEEAKAEEVDKLEMPYDLVSNVMSTDLITVTDTDPARLVLKIMQWRDIRHLPVEDPRGNLQGMITKSRLEDYLDRPGADPLATAADVMEQHLETTEPNADIKYAMLLMIDKGLSCLPVLEKGRLVGIITEKDTESIWKKIKKNEDRKD